MYICIYTFIHSRSLLLRTQSSPPSPVCLATAVPRSVRQSPEVGSPGAWSCRQSLGLLGGSWVVISGVICPLRRLISIVILLITLIITTHEPPRRLAQKVMQNFGCPYGQPQTGRILSIEDLPGAVEREDQAH